MIKISAVICTHNPRSDYFECCLAALQTQTLNRQNWELIVVDNCSNPPLSGRIDLDWHPRARIVNEAALGLTPARLTGIREAAGELLVFIDDDNVLDPDFLEIAAQVAEQMPFIGAWSGQCRPGLERPPPEWARRYFGNLVLREFDRDVWSNLPRLAATMPCGAGLCIRRDAARQYIRLHESGARDFQLDRIGEALLSGGDNDLAACACDVGLGVGLISALKLTHLIPPERLTESYLSRLAEGIYFSAVVLAHLRSEAEEFASYRVRWVEHVKALMKLGPHRSIHLAALRGRQRGLEFVRSLEAQGHHA